MLQTVAQRGLCVKGKIKHPGKYFVLDSADGPRISFSSHGSIATQ